MNANSGDTILFVGESATRAHVARPWSLANTLHRRGWRVAFAADTFFSDVFAHADIQTFSIASRSPHEFQRILEQNGVIFDEAILRRYVEGDRALLNQSKPAVVVGDFRLSLAVSAPLCGIPYIALTNGYWSPSIRSLPLPFSTELLATRGDHGAADEILQRRSIEFQELLPSIFAAQAVGLDRVRQENGLSIFPNYLSGYSWGDRTVYADIPSFVSLKTIPVTHSFIGPICWSPSIESTGPVPLPAKRGKTIYVSLGSSASPLLLEPLLAALRTLDHQVIVATSGAELPGALPQGSVVAPFFPGELAAARSDLVITNGGSPATHQALAAGRPVIGLPFNMDQLLCMDHIEKTGAVLSVRADIATERRIVEAVDRMLHDRRFSEAARSIGRQLEVVDASENLEKIIEDLLGVPEGKKIGGIEH